VAGSNGYSLTDAGAPSLQRWRRRTARWLVRKAFGASAGMVAQTLLPARGIHRVLVCHISHTLGNTLLLTPLIRELQRTYPGAEIDVVTRSPVADDIFGAFAGVRKIYRLPRHGVAAPQRLAGILRSLRTNRYDLAIDPCVRSQSDRVCVMAARATWKLGYVAAKGGDLSHAIAVPRHVRHIGQLPVHLLRCATGRADDAAFPPLDIGLTTEERARGREILRGVLGAERAANPIVGLFTQATGAKHLGAEWWQRFARRLAEIRPDVRIVEIVALAGDSMLDNQYPTFYSTDLRRLASVLSALQLFVGADCGVMHLSCAAGTPTFGLFRGTDVAEWGPYGEGNRAIEVGARTPEEIADELRAPAALHSQPA